MKTQHIKAVIFDLDGTIYKGNKLIDNADKTIKYLISKGIKVYFISNNSSHSVSSTHKKLKRLGINVSPKNILTSTLMAILRLKHEKKSRVYAVGTKEFVSELKANGIIVSSNNPDYVIVAFDRELTYGKLVKACYLIQGGTPYICTNPDLACPTDKGFIPDCGAITSVIEKTTDTKPIAVLGKPTDEMARYIEEYTGYKGNNIVMVGDRLCTEIRMANNNSWHSIAVLSGETNTKLLRKANKADLPDKIINSVADLMEIFK